MLHASVVEVKLRLFSPPLHFHTRARVRGFYQYLYLTLE
jgi:hypothetical protein